MLSYTPPQDIPSSQFCLTQFTKDFIATWTGLSVAIVKLHLPKSYITLLGHLYQQPKNTQSTQPKIARSPQNQQSILAQTAPDDNNKLLRTHNIFASCEPISGKIFSELLGRFPITSTQGMNYVLVVYDYNSNAIICEPMKNITGPTVVAA